MDTDDQNQFEHFAKSQKILMKIEDTNLGFLPKIANQKQPFMGNIAKTVSKMHATT